MRVPTLFALLLTLCAADDVLFAPFRDKMKQHKLPAVAIDSFRQSFGAFVAGGSNLISEASISATEEFPKFERQQHGSFQLANLTV